jgi:ADP-ribose pyrophosphatase YjhB (NUDIX family)
MGYIHELRKFVGSRPLILVGAAVLLLDQKGRLLLLKRSDNRLWGIPGGCMELGESLEETARRETLEETGLRINELELFAVFSGPELFYEYPNGDKVHNVSVVYLSRDTSGEVDVQDEEHTEFAFFKLDQLPESISPPIKPVLAMYIKKALQDKAN